MQVRKNSAPPAKIESQMTPMIDVVFQLLIFFILSFRIVSQEGDFNIKMPLKGIESASVYSGLPPLKLRLESNEQGELAALKLNDRSFQPGDWKEVQHTLFELLVSKDEGNDLRDMAEIDIDCDYRLHYDYALNAIASVSGYKTASGEIMPLVTKVNLAPAR